MARSRHSRIPTDLDTLGDLLKKSLGTNRELPLRFVYDLKKNPEATVEEVASDLGIPSRTASRWYGWFTADGLEAYLSRNWRAPQSSRKEGPHETDGGSAADPQTEDVRPLHEIVHALNHVPTAADPVQWGIEMKGWIREILPQVDQVGINIVNNFDFLSPGENPADLLQRESILTEGGREGMDVATSVHQPIQESIWRAMYGSAIVQGAFRAEDFHPPLGEDYRYVHRGESGYLGSIVLLRSMKNTPFSASLGRQFTALGPLFIRIMAEAVGRFHQATPWAPDFLTALVRLDPEGRLIGRPREVTLLHLGGYSNEEIAEKLSIDLSTVKSHSSNALRLLGFRTVKEMMAKVISPRNTFSTRAEPATTSHKSPPGTDNPS